MQYRMKNKLNSLTILLSRNFKDYILDRLSSAWLTYIKKRALIDPLYVSLVQNQLRKHLTGQAHSCKNTYYSTFIRPYEQNSFNPLYSTGYTPENLSRFSNMDQALYNLYWAKDHLYQDGITILYSRLITVVIKDRESGLKPSLVKRLATSIFSIYKAD